ncbi:MAG: family 20 glycosylhydrolase [Verrucomicrobia bacterium]|nr:family 20 glycosylhydrolase [Verrucomicrobiota bacterium]
MNPQLRPLALLITAVAASGATAQDHPLGTAGDPALKQAPIGLRANPALVQLVPWPMRGTVDDKDFVTLDAATRIVAASPELTPLANILSDEIVRLTQRTIPVAQGPATARDLCLKLNPTLTFSNDPYLKLDPALTGLAQRIEVSPTGILVEGTTYQAAAMASVTLLQALQAGNNPLRLPRMLIEDKPGSRYCGIMLDVARQWHPIEYLYEVVDLCRLYKVPFLHFHFTDDQGYRLPSLAYPKIPTPGGSYSLQEMREFIAYADAHGVTVVPEIELPGHSSALQGAMPEIFGAKNPATGKFDTLGVINIANEEIYPVLDTLIGEACELFKSSPYFHIGADETQFGPFFANPTVKAQLAALATKGVKSEQVFANFINRVNAIVKKHGKQTICWEGFGSNEPVDKDVIIMAWHGSSYAPQALLAAGYAILNVPWTPSINWSARQNYEWNKWLLNLNEQSQSRQFEMNPQVIGGQMVLWEQGPNVAIPTMRDKVPARQERLYSPWACRSFEDYFARFAHTDAMLEKLLYPVAVKLDGLLNTQENLYGDQPVTVTLASPIKNARIYYTVGGKNPTPTTATRYGGPFQIEPKQAGEVYISGYYGPRAELRIRAFGPDDKPLGGTKWIELRCEAPRVAYQLYEAPAGTPFEAMPDVAKLKPLATGRLARFEATGKLARNLGGPLALTASGTFDARSAGEYRIICRSKNVRLTLDGKDVPIPKDGLAPVTLTVGLHPISVHQYANDGNVGVVLTMDKAPPDPATNARRFTNEYIHQWMPPLAK